ncbi:ABC transporter substrate-binding protein, partial [Rhizobiaceae sp. 2RAB30]
MHKSLTLLGKAAFAALLASTAAQAEDSKPIKIGFAIAESGWLSNYDGPPFKAAVMKIEEINKAGGLLGRQIEYTVMDTKTEQERAATAGAQL